MNTEIIRKNNTDVAVISSNELLVKDVQSALDLIMTVKYETGCTNIAVNKEAIVEDFQPDASLAVGRLSGSANKYK